MGKNSRRKRGRSQAENDPKPKPAPSTQLVGPADSGELSSQIASSTKSSNPLEYKLEAFLATVPSPEREHFFYESHVEPERRAELWAQQAEIGEELVDIYSWAIPNERAMSILMHFAPLVEVGCGANAYWCQQMKRAGIDIVGFDINPKSGGKIGGKSKGKGNSFSTQKGGPEVLAYSSNKHRNLFLCYPDENDNADGEEQEEDFSLGLACLEHFQGDYVIHVGEIYGDTLSVHQAPWGRSSSPYFQQRLATEFHCVLQVPLPNWIHVRDTLTVWKRSILCTLVFAVDDEDDDESNEEVSYRYVPPEETLPNVRVAPFLLHLLKNEKTNGSGELPIKTGNAPHLKSETKKGDNTTDDSEGERMSTQSSTTKSKKKQKNSDANETKFIDDEPKTPITGDVKKKKKKPVDKAKEKIGYECSW